MLCQRLVQALLDRLFDLPRQPGAFDDTEDEQAVHVGNPQLLRIGEQGPVVHALGDGACPTVCDRGCRS